MSAPVAVVLESTVEADCPQVEMDELRENSEEIGAALHGLGYRVEIVPFTLDMADVRGRLVKLAPSVAFNLVDSIEGKGNLIAMAPMLLAHIGIPYTGANALSTSASCDKLLTKQILRAQGIQTPEWLTEAQIEAGGAALPRPFILKSITEHASFGMFADSVVATREELKSRWREKKLKYGSEWFAEEYIEGREFNLSVMAAGGTLKAVTLPPAEIVFTSEFPKDKPRIVDYAAKWYEESAECKGTVRNFDFAAQDTNLLAALEKTTLACWDAFGLSGYARVDYRIDAAGTPYVLEVNCNPFLTAREGMGAAAARAGMTFTDLIRAIVTDAYRRNRTALPQVLAA
jgi:D-alanine-D-alanine ligase